MTISNNQKRYRPVTPGRTPEPHMAADGTTPRKNLAAICAPIALAGVLRGALMTPILRHSAHALAMIVLPGPISQAAQAQSPGTTFTCVAPSHHDGDNIRCQNIRGRSMRLYGIDAPEMPGACQAGRHCAPGDPHASRDHLRALTTSQTVRCTVTGRDRYSRLIVRCQTTRGTDLSCAQIRAGHAIPRYGSIQCRL